MAVGLEGGSCHTFCDFVEWQLEVVPHHEDHLVVLFLVLEILLHFLLPGHLFGEWLAEKNAHCFFLIVCCGEHCGDCLLGKAHFD